MRPELSPNQSGKGLRIVLIAVNSPNGRLWNDGLCEGLRTPAPGDRCTTSMGPASANLHIIGRAA
jgi:hypothetical protein